MINWFCLSLSQGCREANYLCNVQFTAKGTASLPKQKAQNWFLAWLCFFSFLFLDVPPLFFSSKPSVAMTLLKKVPGEKASASFCHVGNRT